MVKEFTIQLSQNSFVAGSTIRGSVVVNNNEPKSYKKIIVYLKGHGEVKWTETHITSSGLNGQTSTTTQTRRIGETYTFQEFVVWEKLHSSDGVLPAGRHTFPFQFTIPVNCPSSFRDRIGKIEYAISGKIVSRGFWKRDHLIRYLINVLGFVDADSGFAQEPALYVKEKQLGILCFPRGKITYSVQLPRSLFCVGEHLQTQVKVENESGRQVKVKISLIERINYAIPGRQRHRKNIIMSQQSTSLQPHRTSYFDSENFLVPVIRPAITESNIIKSAYFLHVVIRIPWSWNSSMTIPVVIGNAREADHNSPNTAHTTTLDPYPPGVGFARSPPDIENVRTLYDDPSQPPSYWDCTQSVTSV